jgi:hypothetical protein
MEHLKYTTAKNWHTAQTGNTPCVLQIKNTAYTGDEISELVPPYEDGNKVALKICSKETII